MPPAAQPPHITLQQHGSSSAIIAHWGTMSSDYDNYDVSKGRAMHKIFKGAKGGGEGYWPQDPPYYPTPGFTNQQGLQAAIDDNYVVYDMAHGIAIHKIFKDGYIPGDAGDVQGVSHSGWHEAYHHQPFKYGVTA